MQPADSGSRVAKNASLLGSATAASRVLGFVRDLCIAILLGAGPVADAFFVAIRIPDLMRRMFGEGVWSMVFVPVFWQLSHQDSQGRGRGFALARSVMLWMLALLGLACLVILLFAPQVVGLLAPGMRDTPELLQTAAGLLRICAPYVLFLMAAALSMALLNAMEHFLAPALAPMALNCLLIATALGCMALGAGAQTAAHALAWALLLGGFAQWLVQQPALKARGFSWRGRCSLRDPHAARLGRLALPVLVGLSFFQISGLIATLAAASLPHGNVSWIYYAERLAQLPLGIFSVAVSLAALPELSSLATHGKGREFGQVLRQSLALVLWCSLPAAAGLGALAGPVVALLFGHGAFDGAAVAGTASTLAALCAGLPAFAMVRLLAAASNAGQDRTVPFRAALVSLAFFGLLAWPCMELWQAPGLALAMSLGGWANALLLVLALERRGVPVWSGANALQSLAVCGMAAAVWGVTRLAAAWAVSAGFGGVAVVVLVPALAAAYLLASLALGLPPAVALWRMLQGRRAAGRPGKGR